MSNQSVAPQARIGIIGGSGLYQMDALQDSRSITLDTPFGAPSGDFILGQLEGIPVAFLSRHGQQHTLLPSEINYRANIFAMKKLGVERILSVSAVGSMKEEVEPGHIAIPDQFYDLTKGRKSTFFGEGIVAHVSLANPICPDLAVFVADTAEEIGGIVHRGGTYLCMEGPQFSTRAESDVHRGFGVSVIGMTNATEAKLVREAEMCYVTIALSTDYDCWHVSEAPVTVEMILQVLRDNVLFSKKLLQSVVKKVDGPRSCRCASALKNAIVTPSEAMSVSLKEKLDPIIGKYIS
ncbi:5'-methylthioadenosine phosphorylase [hydrothermal vent metagenome]|uniref:5'-methylthioadenosine phosphorylase n=1 Tax=hydrothermal vent metagenome TaxID=652676 RepID=A0A3B1CUB2_9ZZZZ